MDITYFCGTVGEVGTVTLYRLMSLRGQVFVVARQRPRHDLDGRDIEPGTLHLWGEIDGVPVTTLRLTGEGEGLVRLGRLCTLPAHRRQGYASVLVRHAILLAGGRPLVADVYTRAVEWFTRRGFEPRGGRTIVDGEPHTSIHHVPARRAGAAREQARGAVPGGSAYLPAWSSGG